MANPFLEQVNKVTSTFGRISKSLLDLHNQPVEVRRQALQAIAPLAPGLDVERLATNPAELQGFVNPNILQIFDPSDILVQARSGSDVSGQLQKFQTAIQALPANISNLAQPLAPLQNIGPQAEEGFTERLARNQAFGTFQAAGSTQQQLPETDLLQGSKSIVPPAPQPPAQPAIQAPTSPIQTFSGGNRTTVSIVDFLKSVGQPSDFGSRTGLAQKAGITNYQGTAAQNTQLLNMLKGSAPAPTPSGIAPETLTSEASVQIPGAIGVSDTTGLSKALVDGANTSIAEIMRQLTPPETAADQQKQAILDRITGLVDEQAQSAMDQLTAEQSAGLPQLRQEFADINAQILEKSARYKVLQTENQNKPITMNTIIGNDRAIMNANAADIGLLQARALGLQGQIETAQNTVNRAIDLKYSSIESQLNIYQAQLNALQPTLDKEEKQRALAQQLLLDERKRVLEEQKTQEANIQGVMLEAIKSGITDQQTLNQISNASSYNQALEILGANIPTEPTTPSVAEQLKATEQGFDIVDGQIVPQAQAPVDFAGFDEWLSTTGSITQDFHTSVDYFKDGRTSHGGYDIAGTIGSNVSSPVGGTVVEAGESDAGWGNTVVIEDSNGNNWRMAHFNSLGVKLGQTITAGQSLGTMGNTGHVLKRSGAKPTSAELAQGAGTHLHLEVKDKSGRLVDPKTFKKVTEEDTTSTTSEITGKPLSAAERESRTFATRLSNSSKIIDDLEDQFTGRLSGIARLLPSALKSEDRKSIEQAQRNFVNALLRQESGAAISPEEFESAQEQYFPQPGDTARILKQKSDNRRTVIEGMLLSSGVVTFRQGVASTLDDNDAYSEYLNIINQ